MAVRETIPQLECNGCGTLRSGQVGTSHDDLRQLLAQVGWKSDKARDLDTCPSCLTRRWGTA